MAEERLGASFSIDVTKRDSLRLIGLYAKAKANSRRQARGLTILLSRSQGLKLKSKALIKYKTYKKKKSEP